MQNLNPEFVREDGRGKLIQLITGEFKQINILEIGKGSYFGGHYHKHKTEWFYVLSGEVRVNSELYMKGGYFRVDSGNMHTLEAINDSIIVEILSCPYDSKDIFIEEKE